MNKKQLRKHLQEDIYCRIGRSKIHGVGVIAIRNIPKGTNPFKKVTDFNLVRFKKTELKKLEPQVKKMIVDFLSLDQEDILVPDTGLNALDISFHMNQSKKPNIVIGENEDFFAARNIKEGEELTVDYSTFSD